MRRQIFTILVKVGGAILLQKTQRRGAVLQYANITDRQIVKWIRLCNKVGKVSLWQSEKIG